MDPDIHGHTISYTPPDRMTGFLSPKFLKYASPEIGFIAGKI
jgi:hypothetical protein